MPNQSSEQVVYGLEKPPDRTLDEIRGEGPDDFLKLLEPMVEWFHNRKRKTSELVRRVEFLEAVLREEGLIEKYQSKHNTVLAKGFKEGEGSVRGGGK